MDGGVVLNCLGRGACFQVGEQVSSDDYAKIRSGTLSSSPVITFVGSAFAGVLVTNTAANGSYKTLPQ